MYTTVTFPLIASCISIISMAIVLTITWVTRSSRPRQRVSFTLLSIGVIGFLRRAPARRTGCDCEHGSRRLFGI
jgi:ABC-type Fe3+-siderophore transport system permease subunit